MEINPEVSDDYKVRIHNKFASVRFTRSLWAVGGVFLVLPPLLLRLDRTTDGSDKERPPNNIVHNVRGGAIYYTALNGPLLASDSARRLQSVKALRCVDRSGVTWNGAG